MIFSVNTKQKGILYTVVSTIIFGITPAIGKLTYSMGNNGIQLSFLRHLFVLPIFFLIVCKQKLSFRLSHQQIIDVVKVGLGNALTIVLLYSSYSYIGVGSATVLHFLYPLFVCLLNYVLYQQLLNKKQLICLCLAIIGVLCFMDLSSSSMIGFCLAVLSGIFFAYYMIGMDHTTIRELSPYVFNFYLVLLNVIVLFFLSFMTNSFCVLPIEGYILSFIVSIFTSLIAVVLLQRGIYCLGASTTAILSTLEPITSIVVGILFLKESLSMMKFLGCIFVLLSTIILVKNQENEKIKDFIE